MPRKKKAKPVEKEIVEDEILVVEDDDFEDDLEDDLEDDDDEFEDEEDGDFEDDDEFEDEEDDDLEDEEEDDVPDPVVEKRTVIVIPEGSDVAGVSTFNRKWTNKMVKLAKEGHAEEVEAAVEGAREWEVEVGCIHLPYYRKPRKWTKAQKEEARERLAKVREANAKKRKPKKAAPKKGKKAKSKKAE